MKMQRMQHRPVLVVLLTLAFLLSAMTPVALADRPQCLGTSLQVDITAAVVAEGVQDYDWNLTKSVKPESLLLGPGASGEVTYTIVAERLAQDPEITYTVSGTITVEMTGDYPTTGFQVTPYLARHVGGNDYEEVPGTRSANLADGEMSPDDSPLAFEYTLDIPPGAIDPDEDYKVFAGVSITNHPNDCPKPHLFPAKADVDFPDEPPIVTETDATATLEDAVDLSNADGLAYATGQEWPVTLTDSQTITYTATITNEGAECGQNGLEVTNTATLTPSDSAALTASATVSVTTPACEGVVSVSKTAEGYCRRSVEYDWTVTKKVSDTSLTLKAGESKQVTYTVTVTPEKVKDEVSAGVKGTITVTNDTDAPITLTGYHDWVEYLDGEDWTEVPNAGDTQTMSQTVPAGGFLDIPYDLPFTPVEGAQGYRNCVEVAFQPAVVVAAADFSAPKVSAEREFTLTCQESVEDETASIADVATWPTGFSYQLDDEFPTEFDATESEGPWTLTYKATLTNESVVCGQDVEVKNTVTLTEGDSEDTDQDDATVAVYTGNCNDPSTKRPGIKVTKDVDDHTLRVGQTAHYTYVVENTGNVDLTDITLVDDKLGVQTLTGADIADGVLSPGEKAYAEDSFTGLEPGQVCNTATASGRYSYDEKSGTVSDDDTECVEFRRSSSGGGGSGGSSSGGGGGSEVPQTVEVPEQPQVEAPVMQPAPLPLPVQVPVQAPAAAPLPFTGGNPLLFMAAGMALTALGGALRRRM